MVSRPLNEAPTISAGWLKICWTCRVSCPDSSGLEIAGANLRTIIDDALTAIRPAADAKHLLIKTDIDNDMVIRADPQRLQQVLWNLLSNSVKFTPPGGVVTVTTRRTNESVTVQVTDTGLGIEPELLPRVFDRFRQGDGSPSRSHGGLGLGLSIVRNIAELHGGTVVAVSRGRNQGTTMTMTLPVWVAPHDADAVRGTGDCVV